MSINISKVVIYLKLMLDEQTPKEQKFGLLYRASPVQIRALTEIVHNLLFGSLTLNESRCEILTASPIRYLNDADVDGFFALRRCKCQNRYRSSLVTDLGVLPIPRWYVLL